MSTTCVHVLIMRSYILQCFDLLLISSAEVNELEIEQSHMTISLDSVGSKSYAAYSREHYLRHISDCIISSCS